MRTVPEAALRARARGPDRASKLAQPTFADIAREQGVDFERHEGLHVICRPGEDEDQQQGPTNFLLATADERGVVQPTDLWGAWRRFVKFFKPTLVFYDPLADLFAGNENSRPQAQQFVSMLRGLALETSSRLKAPWRPLAGPWALHPPTRTRRLMGTTTAATRAQPRQPLSNGAAERSRIGVQ